MTTDNVEKLTAKISFLEKKINRIEQLLLLLVEEEYLSEEEKDRIVQADQIVKDKEFDKLVKVEYW
ncbi:MAG: hypothetical protein GPJ51_05595 [Candidatus Heimdallarchaeota archaeon]|nr:hypothetical protein [Candidatus Heimdallarchaeota archaeon]